MPGTEKMPGSMGPNSKPMPPLSNTINKSLLLAVIFIGLFLGMSNELLADFDPEVLELSQVKDTSINISNYCAWYVDKSGDQRKEEIASSVNFVPFHKDSANIHAGIDFNYTYWIKLHIKYTGENKDSVLLKIGKDHARIVMYQKGSNGLIPKGYGGFFINARKASFKKDRLYLPIVLEPDQFITLFIKVVPNKRLPRLNFSPTISSFDKEKANRLNELLTVHFETKFFTVGLSILLFFSMLNFGNYLIIRDKSYVYYSLFLLGMFLHIQTKAGFWFHPISEPILYNYFDDNIAGLIDELAYPIAYIGYVLFVKSFLDLVQKHPKINRYFNFIIKFLGLVSLYLFIDFFLDFPGDRTSIWLVLMAILLLLCLYGLFLLWHINSKLTSIIILGTTLFFVIVLIGFAIHLGLNPFKNTNSILLNYVYAYILAGVLVESVFFSIGLVYRTKLVELEKQEAIKGQELARAKAKLFANITHEFRTPLTIIKGNANLIVKNPKVKLEERIAGINQYADTLKRLVDDMLDLTKLESGSFQLKVYNGNLSAYLNYLVESFQTIALANNITLSYHTQKENLMMDYSAIGIQQIITNLVDNALKFTPEFGKISVALSTNQKKEAIITIKDSGRGIQAVELDNVFEPFYQAEHQDLQEIKGTGLGLAIVKELVQLMNGRIEVQSQVNLGTTFLVKLPITQHEPPFPKDKTAFTTKQGHQTSKKTEESVGLGVAPSILIVEDNPDVRQYLKDLLFGNYAVITAKNGKEGLEKTRKEEPTIIISDEMMPVMSGFQLLETLKNDEQLKHIPVIMLTARASRAEELKGLKLKADAYLKKPLDEEKLLILLSNLVEQTKNQVEPTKSMTMRWNGQLVYDDFMKEALQILEERCTDSDFRAFDLKYALQKRGYGADRKVERLLKKHFDSTPAKLIKEYRLEKSNVLLKTRPDLSIPDIIELVGLNSDQSHFTKMFKEKFKNTPSSARK